LTTDGSLILYTWNDKEGKKLLAFYFARNGASFGRIYPGNKLTLEPAIDNGFIMMLILVITKLPMQILKKLKTAF
jgi:threonyl-tRNA synthetase